MLEQLQFPLASSSEASAKKLLCTDWHESDGESRGDPRPDLKLLINVEDVETIDQAPTAIVPGDTPAPAFPSPRCSCLRI